MIIAVDTGGTKTLVAGSDSEGRFHTRHRFSTPRDTSEYIQKLSSVIKEHFDVAKIRAISVAVPGPVEGKIVVFCPNIDIGWENFELVHHLKKSLGINAPVFLQNDSNMAGLAETHALSPVPKRCLYVTISTGIGVSATKNGKIDSSLELTEGGHMMLEYDGIMRQWEHFASGKAIYETYGRYARDIKAKSVWEQITDKISRGFLVIVPLLQPDTIVIGGSIGTHFKHYGEGLSKILDQQLVSYLPRPKIVQATHPEEAVIYGCKIYAEQKLS